MTKPEIQPITLFKVKPLQDPVPPTVLVDIEIEILAKRIGNERTKCIAKRQFRDRIICRNHGFAIYFLGAYLGD